MFNPFKKKESEYKLDDYSIPSLSETKNSTSEQLTPLENPFEESPSLPQLPNQSPQNDFSMGQNNFNGMQSPSSNPFIQAHEASQQITNQNNQTENMSTAKLELIETKIALMETKFQTIESKLDIIIKLIESEVSDETKKRLNVSRILESMGQKEEYKNPKNI